MNVERQPIMFLLMRRIFAYKASSVCVGLWACLVWSFICVIGNKDKVTFFFSIFLFHLQIMAHGLHKNMQSSPVLEAFQSLLSCDSILGLGLLVISGSFFNKIGFWVKYFQADIFWCRLLSTALFVKRQLKRRFFKELARRILCSSLS